MLSTRTIPRLFRAAVEEAADRVWIVSDEGELTYGAALGLVQRAAGALRERGIGSGDRVLAVAPGRPGTLLLWLALAEVGAVQVPLNPKSTPAELDGFVRQVEPALVVPEDDLDGLFEGPADERGPADVDPTDVAVMIPTSGTTGRSKLVMQTHVAYVMAAEGFPWWLGLTSEDRLLTALPLFHLNAPAYTALGSVAARASMALLPGFSAGRFLGDARRFGATQVNCIGAMVEILMRQPETPADRDHRVRLCYTGPAPPRERHLQIERRFGWRVMSGYALSESTYGTVWRPGTRPYGTIGAPRQHPHLGHVNDAEVVGGDGRPVPVGEVGELLLRNPATMRGYYQMPEETAAVLVGGWLRTGDLVFEDHAGDLTFVGRKKDVIRRRGENLSPLEVEAVLEQHPDVAEAAVVGVASELSEQEVKAFVVAAPGCTVDPAALGRFAAERLSPYKVPRYVEVVDDLPHTPTGRVAKHRLPAERNDAEHDLEEER